MGRRKDEPTVTQRFVSFGSSLKGLGTPRRQGSGSGYAGVSTLDQPTTVKMFKMTMQLTHWPPTCADQRGDGTTASSAGGCTRWQEFRVSRGLNPGVSMSVCRDGQCTLQLPLYRNSLLFLPLGRLHHPYPNPPEVPQVPCSRLPLVGAPCLHHVMGCPNQ
jgi:hypothetical protein